MRKSCATCGTTYPAGGQCPRHPRRRGPSSVATSAPGWGALRRAVLERDGHRCQWPVGEVRGHVVVHGAPADEVDHIVPASRGGRSEMSNLRALCFDHNRGKGGR